MKRISPQALIGVVLIFAVLIAFFLVTSSFQKKEGVMVAKGTLTPFVRADDSLTVLQVPKASVTEADLTQAEYEANYKKPSKPVLPLISIIEGQRIQEGALAADAAASFGAVLPDERVIAVNATLAGAVLASLHPGSVVDVQPTGSNGGAGQKSFFDKVLCITDKPDGCKNVVPDSSLQIEKAGGGGLGGASAGIYLLLAVPEAEALDLAGQQVLISLNPFCAVGKEGRFVSPRLDEAAKTGSPCEAPPGRIASTPAPKPALVVPEDPADEGSGGTTTESPPTETAPKK